MGAGRKELHRLQQHGTLGWGEKLPSRGNCNIVFIKGGIGEAATRIQM
jgi:hypothetical protein